MGEEGLIDDAKTEEAPDNTSPVDGTIESLFSGFAKQLLFF